MKDNESFGKEENLDIALIGMAGQFPGAKTIEQFWQNLRDGRESISFFSDNELASATIDRTLLDNPNYVKAAPILEDIERFDAAFFGFEPQEAEVIDPQHRFFLECAWEALESAGYDPETYNGAIGIYGGASTNTYLLENLYSNRDIIDPVGGGSKPLQGISQAFLTTSVSYKLNLKGPSITLQTFCSTSLVAVHLACQSLLNEECDMALAGGVSIRVPQKAGYFYQEGGMLSPDGHCRAFDAKGRGTVFGSGVGLVVLKRLEDAIADGDCIHAVIKGSAVNNDGSLKVNYTAPSVEGQADAIVDALESAGVNPEEISYIETHGTGTAMGDLIEIAALNKAFDSSNLQKGFCAIGSVKTNVGHLDAAAGIASLIKTTLALKHEQIPPSLHFERANPQIDFANSPFYVNTKLSEWKADRLPRRAGVSALGYGGTNAHIILEEAPAIARSEESRPWQLLVLSAKTPSALDVATANLAAYLKQHPKINLADVAYTLQIGRKAFNHRRIAVCQNVDDAAIALETKDPERVFTVCQERAEPPIAFMFPGQGTQYANMARELYQTEAIFREQVDICSNILQPHLGLDLRHLLYPSAENVQRAAEQLKQTAIAQPALFVVEYALAKLWQQWGIRPQATIGQSIGEYVAACLAGVFSLEDALALVVARGQLMQQMPDGAMLAAALSETDVQPFLGETLSLAEVSEVSQCIVSGPVKAVEALQSQLTSQGVECLRLQTSHAFHSQMTEPILEPFSKVVKQVKLNPPQIPVVSTVTGTWMTAAEATDPGYWTEHLRQTVRFADGIKQLLQNREQILLEVGPGGTLSALARRHPDRETDRVVLTSLRQPQERKSDVAFLLNALGQLWLAGVRIDRSGFYSRERRHRLPLPTYPFERQRYWIEPKKQQSDIVGKPVEAQPTTSESTKKPDIGDWFYLPSWKLSPRSPNELKDESVLSNALVLLDEYGLGTELVKRLESEGREPICISIGSQLTRSSDRAHTLNPENPDDWDALIEELSAANKLPKTIVHLWNVTAPDRAELGLESLNQSQATGFYSLLFLARALGKQRLTDGLQIAVVSNGMQDVTGERTVCPEKAIALGPVTVIPQEYPNISCRSIDIELAESDKNQQQAIDRLLAELTAPPSDKIIAYRGDRRWVQTFEPQRLEKAADVTPRLRTGGVYLITGGLGGIGLALAEHLAQTVGAKLILIGRSALPPRDRWEQWLATRDRQDEVSCKIREIQKLEKLGAEVLAIGADVANLEQMQAAIARARERFGAINGAIHAAGVPGDRTIQRQTPSMTENILAPKVKGALVLDEIFKNAPLDFFVSCSSLASILGGLGQAEYAGANAFLDAFARYKNARNGTFAVSINWDTWQEVGMAAAAMRSPLTPEDSPEPQYREVTHPLLERCLIEESGQEIYIGKLSVGKHWVLNEHRVNGKATLPGTAYLEMAVAALKSRANKGDIEIREVYFLEPLMVEEHEEKEVRTLLTKRGDGFEFLVVSQSNSQADKWHQHARGEIAWIEAESPEKEDLAQITTGCNERELIISEAERKPQSGFIDLGRRWSNLKQVKLGKDRGLAILELPEVFADEIGSYQLHPALLDIAVGFLNPEDNGIYLPFSYRKLRLRGPLPVKLYSYIAAAEASQARTETLKFNITIMDERGVKLVEIEDYTLRKVEFESLPVQQSPGSKETDPPLSEGQNFCLEIASPGSLDTLTFQPTARQKPNRGEVEIEVATAGLNFREVLIALGMIPIPPGIPFKFGRECAGKIVALGEGVENFQVGERVMAFGDSCFSPFITAPAALVASLPDSLSLEQGATIPAAFITAYYALINLGRLRPGDRVLIHAAAGGVGMAAVEIAQWVGAEIFATAGNPEKRAFLHAKGIERVMNSRTLDFADEVMELTDGRGVDVLLNSLAGEFMTKSLSIMAPYGRFIELGKRDIFNNTQIGLRLFEKCLSFFAVEVGTDLADFIPTWHEVVEHFHHHHFSPLPHREFSIAEVASAFEYMARANHIGKIVISLQDKEILKNLAAANGKISHQTIASSLPLSPSNPSELQTAHPFKPGLLTTEGIEAFRRILGSEFSQVAVSTRDLPSRIDRDRRSIAQDLLAEADPRSQPKASGSAFVAPRNEIEQRITVIWQEVLEREKVGIYDNFFEIGGNSLLMVQVQSKLEAAFNDSISVADLFEYPTIGALAEYLSRKQVEEPAFQQANERAKKKEEAMQEKRQLMKQRRKARG